jgi:hypothetical protein
MQRSKSNEFTKEVDRTSGLLGEAILNAVRLAVPEEIREAFSAAREPLLSAWLRLAHHSSSIFLRALLTVKSGF